MVQLVLIQTFDLLQDQISRHRMVWLDLEPHLWVVSGCGIARTPQHPLAVHCAQIPQAHLVVLHHVCEP